MNYRIQNEVKQKKERNEIILKDKPNLEGKSLKNIRSNKHEVRFIMSPLNHRFCSFETLRKRRTRRRARRRLRAKRWREKKNKYKDGDDEGGRESETSEKMSTALTG